MPRTENQSIGDDFRRVALYYPDVAKLAGRPVGTLRRDVARGKIPHHKPYGPRGRVVFFRDEIVAWLRGQVTYDKGE